MSTFSVALGGWGRSEAMEVQTVGKDGAFFIVKGEDCQGSYISCMLAQLETGRTKRRAPNRSPHSTHNGSFQDKGFADNQKEGSPDNVEGKQSPSTFHLTYGSAEEQDFSRNDEFKYEVVIAYGSTVIEREEIALDITATGTSEDEKRTHSVKNQTLISRAARYLIC